MPPVVAVLGTVLGALGGGSALAGAGALGSLAATGVGIGEQVANSGGGGPSKATLQQEQLTQDEANQKQQQQQLLETFKHFAPNAQEASSGSLDDNSFAALVDTYAGQPGSIGTAKDAIFGNAGTTVGTGLAAG